MTVLVVVLVFVLLESIVTVAWLAWRTRRRIDVGTIIMLHIGDDIVRDQERLLWEAYAYYLGGVTDRFMSWCDALAEAHGDQAAAAVIHRRRYPEPISDTPTLDPGAIADKMVDDLRQMGERP